MRDAAGQAADRFELLRLAQLFFERAPLGDVADESGQHRAVVRSDAGDGQFDRELAAVGAESPQLGLAARERSASGRQVLAEGAHSRRPVFRGQQQLDVAAEDVEPLVAEHLLGRRIELADVELVVHRDDRVLRRFENGALARLALAARAIHPVDEVERR